MRFFASLFLVLLSPITVWASCADCDSSPGYAEVTTLDAAISEAPGFFKIDLSDLPSDWHTAMSDAGDTDGKSIRVSYSGNQVPCYPLGINTGTDTGAIFVYGANASPSANTLFKVYVGDSSLTMPAVTDPNGRNATFSAYTSVYILNSLTDLTGSGANLTNNGAAVGGYATDYEGVLAYDFNGSSQYLDTSSPTVTDWPLTIESLSRPDGDTVTRTIAAFGTSTQLNNFALLRDAGATAGDPVNFAIRGNSGTESSATSTTGFTISTWQYKDGSRDADAGTSKASISGGSVGTQSTTVSAAVSFNIFAIGVLKRSSLVNYYDGKIAYIGISNSARSNNYRSTMANVWTSTVYSVGSWVPASSGMTAKQKGRGFFALR